MLPRLQAPVLPATVTEREAKSISGPSLVIPFSSGKVEGPAQSLKSVMTKGKLKRVLPLPSDALRASKSVISVSGKTYVIPCQPGEKYQQSVSLALSFQNIFVSPLRLSRRL